MFKFKEFLQEGVNDPAIFKVVFLSGGSGSGKSFILGKSGITSLGLRVVNFDHSFEHMMKKIGKKIDPAGFHTPERKKIMDKAWAQTKKKEAIYLKGRLGMVIDGTGKDYGVIKDAYDVFKNLGYDAFMMTVNVDKETAVSQNRSRDRQLPDDAVRDFWQKVQKNLGKFQTLFGKKNFLVVDNSMSKRGNTDKETLRAYKEVQKFIKRPVENPIAKKWIESEKKARGITRIKRG